MHTIKIIFGFIATLLIFSCDNTPDNEITTEPFPERKINHKQYFTYKNTNGENLFITGIYKEEYLSLIATDENGNDLYIEGELIADIENYVEIFNKATDEEGNVINLGLRFVPFIDTINSENEIKAYYKLKYDVSSFDFITVFYKKDNIDEYITKVIYNGIEYPFSDLPIEIIKE